jgi:hypothetical protein
MHISLGGGGGLHQLQKSNHMKGSSITQNSLITYTCEEEKLNGWD